MALRAARGAVSLAVIGMALAAASAGAGASGVPTIIVEPGDVMTVQGSDIECVVSTVLPLAIGCVLVSQGSPLAGSYEVAMGDSAAAIVEATGSHEVVGRRVNPAISGPSIPGSSRTAKTFSLSEGEHVEVAGTHVECQPALIDDGTVQAIGCGIYAASGSYVPHTYAVSLTSQYADILAAGSAMDVVVADRQPSPPTGSAAAIRLFGRLESAMASYGGIRFTGGQVSYEITPEAGYDSFAEGFGSVPSGYTRATDEVLVVQHEGLVAQEVDMLSAPGLPGVREWQAASDAGVAAVADQHPCTFSYDADDHYVTVGTPYFGASLSGYRFTGPTSSGADEIVGISYSAAGGRGSITLTINRADDLLEAFTLHLQGGPDNGLSLSEESFKYSSTQGIEQPPSQLRKCP